MLAPAVLLAVSDANCNQSDCNHSNLNPRAWQQLPRFRGDAQFTTWLYRIVTRRALNKLGRAKSDTSLDLPSGGRRQARIAKLIGSGVVAVQALDQDEAQAVGALCGHSGSPDVVDASVALLARRRQAKVVTSDPEDLRRGIKP